MNRKFIILIVLAALVFVVGGMWWLRGRGDVKKESATDTGPVVDGVVLDTAVPDSIPPLQIEGEPVPEPDIPVVYADEQGEQLKQVTRLFVEAWGSQSSLNGYQSFDMAAVYATDAMKFDLQDRKSALLAAENVPNIVTTVYGLNIEKKESTRMTIVASARRVERAHDDEKTYNQKATVILTLIGSDWLVSDAEWAEATF